MATRKVVHLRYQRPDGSVDMLVRVGSIKTLCRMTPARVADELARIFLEDRGLELPEATFVTEKF